MAIKVIAQRREVKLGKKPGMKFVMRPDLYIPIAEKKVFAEASTLYSEAFTLTDSVTVKAIAIKNGESSEVATKSFNKSSNSGGAGFDNGN